MFFEKILRPGEPRCKEVPQTLATNLRAMTPKACNGPLRVYLQRLVYNSFNHQPVAYRSDFPKRNPGLCHSKRSWVHPEENHSLLARTELVQIIAMRFPGVMQWVIDVGHRGSE